MTDISTMVVTPKTVADAYGQVDRGSSAGSAGGIGGGNFGGMVQRALQGAIDAGHAADTQSIAAINGSGNLTEVVTAVARAELALQSATAIRDRVVQAYQDIIKMPI